uniref:Enoyl-CoA hydratase n=1 Tax=Panagrolaimus sp. PS1159 TaxID=55785 RepID=A0AC35G6E5_9BILA
MALRSFTLSSKFLRHSKFLSFRSLSTETETPQHLFEREIYQDNKVVRLVLNAPKTRNSLSLALIESLFKELQEIDAIEKIRAVILAGKGPAFSAGHDLKELTTGKGSEYHKEVFNKCTQLLTFIQRMQLPVIAEIDGVAAAAGCQLISSCDVVKIALDMLLTGRSITAEEALRAGLVSRISKEGEEPRIEALKVAEEICKYSRSVTAIGKTFFYTQVELSQRDAYRFVLFLFNTFLFFGF